MVRVVFQIDRESVSPEGLVLHWHVVGRADGITRVRLSYLRREEAAAKAKELNDWERSRRAED